MPDIKTHCAISKKRIGEEFQELHEWIDEAQKTMGVNHRLLHHSYNEADMTYVKTHLGGEKAVIEWLFHIALDNLETAFKASLHEYGNTAYKNIKIKFYENNSFIECEFF